MKNCTFIELKKLGHFLMMENPDKVIDTILPFIQDTRAKAVIFQSLFFRNLLLKKKESNISRTRQWAARTK